MSIKENIENIKKRIKEAAERSGRNEEDIVLIGVTKTVDTDIMKEAIKFGIDNIGENRVQEMKKKYEDISENLNWHMIGHLQSNKVKYIIDKVSLIHSLDRMSLAKELEKRAEQHNITVNSLIQVNIAEEESKFGLKGEEVIPFIENILKFERINIKGLMTIAPFDENPENVRYVFRQLKGLAKDIEAKGYSKIEMKYLSMGMTNDFEVAIEEGSNMVRIGTGIFGKRTY
ncbi:YggS family pyridoxal phosphate-dependent enzyme [Caldisalinibacter kiritimatiensis]|uniref:Pyridoxal phosphate homeostasis protein n=1 Tax=Caldisalinibacter kiritimatiensis TaxID=1304284 RepID=R1CRI3_9FIRM|nr:YggS family pyridoxal phosphate-dependent enzyme [Caldisalinibacter kiritimatiensis]EOD01286.1 Pyridoxal phosphate enzyme, YggS family [Caldisalinibacter kiritimatiensis]